MINDVLGFLALVAGATAIWWLFVRDFVRPVAYEVVEIPEGWFFGRQFRIRCILPKLFGSRWLEYPAGIDYSTTWWSDTREGAERMLARVQSEHDQTS